MDYNPTKPDLHQRILAALISPYEGPVINNVDRGPYVEHLIAEVLGPEWSHSGSDWAAWDCEHKDGDRIQIKQSAAQQSWDTDKRTKRKPPSFKINPSIIYWKLLGGQWVKERLDPPRRLSDIYVFAWHGGLGKNTDHRDPAQWIFFVVPELDLTEGQKNIGLGPLKELATPCRIADLRQRVESARPARAALKADIEQDQP